MENGAVTKPLFDSEHFSFIGSEDNQIFVHCRKCGQQAEVEVDVLKPSGPELIARCPGCHNRGSFVFVRATGKRVSASR